MGKTNTKTDTVRQFYQMGILEVRMENYKKRTMKYCALQGTYWMLAAVGLAFVTPLLEAKGFNSMEIGWLNAVKYISVIFFQVWIAAFSDRHAKTFPMKWIMQIMGVTGIISAVAFWFLDNNFAEAVIIFILYGAVVNCLSPIVDSLSVQYMNHGQDLHYTLSRACGSGTWAVACVVIGSFSDCFGINNILILQIVSTIAFLAVTVIMEPVDFSKDEKVEKATTQDTNVKRIESQEETPQEIRSEVEKAEVHSSWYLIRNYPKYTLFLAGCMIIFMGYNLNATFMIDVVEGLGGSHTDFGLAEFVLAAAEMPVAIFFSRMRKKFSIDQMMVICAIFCTLRAAATTFAPTVLLVILSQGFEILGLGIFYAGSVYFVMENLPETDVVKGVSFINVASVGVGQAIASVCCGMIKSAVGLHNLLIISSLVSFLAVLVMLLMKIAPKKGRQIA